MTRTLMIALALSATACKGGSPAAAGGAAAPASAAASSAASVAPASAAPAGATASQSGLTVHSASNTTSQADTGHHGGGAGEFKWAGPVQWKPWAEAQTQATAEKKRIMLVVYANWCPRCRELAPVFADPEVAALAEKLVMVRQDSDEKPAWLDHYAEFGGYVPRIFFIDADGTVNPAITSGHPRYPFFFSSHQVGAIKAAMKKAAEG